MKFGPASPADAIGGVTVHTLRQGPLVLKKGTTIGAAEVEALTRAGVDHMIETYPAKHGWVFRDIPVYDAAAAERHWQTMVALLDAKLKA